MNVPPIVLIGAGNVGDHLGRRLFETGFEILQIYSRREEKARRLAESVQADWTNDLQDINPAAGLYLIAVPDDAVPGTAKALARLPLADPLVAHTSGSTSSDVLAPRFDRYGVFYPLQTFSAERPVDFSKVPICIYSPDSEAEKMLLRLGQAISGRVYRIDDRERAVLHVAAVFVNNFSNHLFHIGHHILEEENLSFDLIRPLIIETAMKVQQGLPQEMQTGPARRGDRRTIEQHLSYLDRYPEWRELYRRLTTSIRK